MTPNGTTPAPQTYNASWCNERHERLDRDMEERKEADKEITTEMKSLKDSLTERMGKLEGKVAKIMGGIGVILILIEVGAKLLGKG